MNRKKIIFRVDANKDIGLGHLVRCISLAEMLDDHYACTFAVFNPDPTIERTISSNGYSVINLTSASIPELLSHLKGNEIVVLDGYQFTEVDQKQIKEANCKLICIDDLNEYHFVADIVVNHSISDLRTPYSAEPYTQVLTGADYILLRKPFLMAALKRKEIKEFKNIFICFGGSDKEDLCYKFCEMLLQKKNNYSLYVLLGPAYSYNANRFNNLGTEEINVFTNLGANEIVEIMNKCDLGIVPASGIAYECIAVGLPIITGYYVQHQKEFYNALIKQNNVNGLDNWIKVSVRRLEEAIINLSTNYNFDEEKLIDGNQPIRYREILKHL